MSLLKNSALSAMSVFQLLCSIFMILLSKLRSGLKDEIGVFFPMLILRGLENVLQPSFQQKMTVLSLLEKVCQDPQTIIDIFVNYDCDVETPNIFERVVNGLLKTALGVPPGSATTLSPAPDSTFQIESVKCLTNIIQSMGTWMDEQLKIDDTILGTPESDHSKDGFSGIANGEEGTGIENELHFDANFEKYNAATLEQRRVYKLELQMSKADFIRNNRGIDDGKDLPEEYVGTLYDQIVKNEIKMKADSSAAQNKQASNTSILLVLDNIFNLVNWKQAEEKALGASDMLIKNIQEQFKKNSGKSESTFYTVTETGILRFMTEVCWAPMIAAFSMTLDQSDDKVADMKQKNEAEEC